VDIAARYRVKRIVVKPGSTLSLQKHFHRSEHWVVVKGTAEVTIGNDTRTVQKTSRAISPLGAFIGLPIPARFRSN
jgi:mannose-6-phosphate isomerase-like protein (cupin superfamily)